MKHTEHAYIEAGYKYERGQIQAQTLRQMIETENPTNQTEARRLIEQGRQEARATT